MRRSMILLLLMSCVCHAVDPCPAMLDRELKVLRKETSVNLCERYAGSPMLIVNTASHCGYTPQFKGLEQLHRAYAARGLKVAGFPSDDFRQEADTEEDTARICYVNYGVTFDMYAPIHVRGSQAHPLFAELARQSKAPSWNFSKYVVDREGKVVAAFGPGTEPDDAALREAIESVLAPP